MRQIARYQVEDIAIGSGGMGTILKGYDPNGIPVAIKEILPEFATDLEYRSRIVREVEFLRKLNNDNIVKIYEFFPLGNNLYIVMELVEGMNIEQYIEQRGAQSLDIAANIMLKILEVMQYVHEQGIIHRDIKPSNIMLRPNGQICLLDFGIAKDMNGPGGTTLYGTVLGTDGYMSPEQADGMSVDHRTDIYSLACVFYFMLTGHHAYNMVGSEIQMKLDIVNNPFPPISKYIKGIPNSVQIVMDRATDKNMMKRYQSCREFGNELRRATGIGTQLNTANHEHPVISIGRENCDLCVAIDNYRVSRHHADVQLREFTGGSFYVYTDCSSNGTLIDGHLYTKGKSCNIPKGRIPQVFLAGDFSCPLDWDAVTTTLEKKIQDAVREYDKESALKPGDSTSPANTNGNQPHQASVASQDVNTSMGFLDAIKSCFKKYAVFRGRARRAEYWYFYLMNIILIAFLLLLFLFHQDIVLHYVLCGTVSLVTLLPGLAVSVRRMHDVGHSGWHLLWIYLTLCLPLIGLVVFILFIVKVLAKRGSEEANKYGESPL